MIKKYYLLSPGPDSRSGERPGRGGRADHPSPDARVLQNLHGGDRRSEICLRHERGRLYPHLVGHGGHGDRRRQHAFPRRQSHHHQRRQIRRTVGQHLQSLRHPAQRNRSGMGPGFTKDSSRPSSKPTPRSRPFSASCPRPLRARFSTSRVSAKSWPRRTPSSSWTASPASASCPARWTTGKSTSWFRDPRNRS